MVNCIFGIWDNSEKLTKTHVLVVPNRSSEQYNKTSQYIYVLYFFLLQCRCIFHKLFLHHQPMIEEPIHNYILPYFPPYTRTIYSTLNPQTSNLKPQTSNLKPHTNLKLKPQTSYKPTSTSSLEPQTSNLKPQTPNLKPQTLNLKP